MSRVYGESMAPPVERGSDDEVRFARSIGSRRSSGVRGHVVLAVVAGLVVVAIGVAGPRGDGGPPTDTSGLVPGPSGETVPPGTPVASPSSLPVPTPYRPPATPLPRVEAFAERGIADPFPVVEVTQGVLDPATGRFRHLSADFVDGAFVPDDAGGTVCICRTRPGDLDEEIERLFVVRWDATGTELERVPLADIRADRPRLDAWRSIVLDIALTIDRRTVLVASATLAGDRWISSVDAYDIATAAPLWSRRLADRPLAGASSPDRGRIVASVSARISPDGDLASVSVIDGFFDAVGTPSWHRSVWRIPLADGIAGDPSLVVDEAQPADAWCQGESYATADRSLSVCAAWSRAGRVSTVVRLASGDGTIMRDVPIGGHGIAFAPGLIDATAGALYLWDPTRHTLVRVDLATGDGRVVVHGSPRGRPVPGSAAGGGTAGLDLALGDGLVTWVPLSSPLETWIQTPLVGSRDGRYLYAAGLDMREEGLRTAIARSTGIWVFEAATLELVRIIPPAATHDALSLTADGRYLLALGVAGLDEDGRPSDWATSVSIFDARTGALLQRFGDPAPQPYHGVSLVWPPPFD